MKTVIKLMSSALALSFFAVSASFAQSTGTVQDAQSDDTYTQDGTQDGTIQSQDDQYTTQDGTQGYETQNQDQMGQNENRTQIAKNELPSEVNNAIEDGEYSDWTVAEVYEVKEQDEKVYEIHFQNEQGQTEKEKFKQNGDVAR